MAATDETKPRQQRTRRSETTAYIVQVQRKGDETWRDVSALTVPAGTRRATVLEKVKAEVPLALEPGDSALLRVIPFAHAKAESVSMEQPPPQLRIG